MRANLLDDGIDRYLRIVRLREEIPVFTSADGDPMIHVERR